MPAPARCGVGGLAVLLLCACAHAPPTSAPEPQTAPATGHESGPPADQASSNPFTACLMPDQDTVAVLDETARRLHETVCGAALWFDSLFGEGDVAAARETHGRLEVTNSYSQFEGSDDTRVRLNARVRLPALQHRLSAFIGRDNEENFARDRAEGQALRTQVSQVDRVEDWFAGLGYTLRNIYGVQTEAQVGVHGVVGPTVFARVRASYIPYSDPVKVLHLRLTPFINNKDGYGATGNADFDHTLSTTLLLRFGDTGTITQRSAGLEWRSALILYQSLLELRSLAYELFVRGATDAPEPLTEYGVRAIYRQPLLQARLFANLVLGYSWPRIDPSLPREGSFNASFGLELPFGSDVSPLSPPH